MHVKRFQRALDSLQAIPDPLTRLEAVRSSLEHLEALEASTVAAARAAGALYGLSKQGAQQRFRALRSRRATSALQEGAALGQLLAELAGQDDPDGELSIARADEQVTALRADRDRT